VAVGRGIVRPRDLDQEQRRRHRNVLDSDVRRICYALADLGAVEVTDTETIADDHGYQRELGGRVALTPLGVAAVHELAGR
jgi:hypothetical protein